MSHRLAPTHNVDVPGVAALWRVARAFYPRAAGLSASLLNKRGIDPFVRGHTHQSVRSTVVTVARAQFNHGAVGGSSHAPQQ